MAVEVHPVKGGKAFRDFVALPCTIYREDPYWVQPLWSEEKKKFSPEGNAMLRHCDTALFLALRNGRPVGRIATFVDHVALAHWKEAIGLFGSYECLDDPGASAALLQSAGAWLKARGMTRMRGPWSFNAEEWGLLVEGEGTPMILSPYNPPYYANHLSDFGLTKAKDLYVYGLTFDPSDHLPSRFLERTEAIARRTGVKIRPINMRDLRAEVRRLVHVANESTGGNWGHVPVTDEEADELAKALRPVVDPELVMLAEAGGRPIGYQITLPDLNVILKRLHGRLFPFGVFRLLWERKRIRRYRVWAMGVIPAYRRRAIDTLFFREMHRVLAPRRPVTLEANWVLEDNHAMRNPIHKLGFTHVKTYRVFEKSLV